MQSDDRRYESIFQIFPIKTGTYGYSFEIVESKPLEKQKKSQPYCTRVFFDIKLYVKINKNRIY